jgi:peptide/nickel transport system permease protein
VIFRWLLLLVALLVFIGPLVYAPDPWQTRPEMQLQPPSTDHPLGTDLLGRDVLSRTLHGGQRTLVLALLATGLALSLGLPLGLAAGLPVPAVRRTLPVLLNALLALPTLLIGLVVLTVLGRGWGSLVLALAIAQVAPLALVTRGAVLAIWARDYVQAATNLGASRRYVLVYYVLVNALPTILAYGGVVFSMTLLNGAAFTFLGFSGEPGVPDWGSMLAEGRAAFRVAPWIGLGPGVLISLTIWSVNRWVDRLV